MRHFRKPARKAAADRAGTTTTYTSAQDFYIYQRAAPLCFEEWLNYAREQRCILEVYDQIEHDLAPFRKLPGTGEGRTITRAMIAAAAQLEQTAVFSIQNGTLSSTAAAGDPPNHLAKAVNLEPWKQLWQQLHDQKQWTMPCNPCLRVLCRGCIPGNAGAPCPAAAQHGVCGEPERRAARDARR